LHPSTVKVHVDPDLCQGHARCWQICPEVFLLDEEGHSYVESPDVPAGLEDKVREAADNCPERAITVT
jgi:ferredoxin